MRTKLFVSSLSLATLVFASAPASAQTTNAAPAKPHVVDVPQPTQSESFTPPPPSGPPPDPAKVAEYQRRFEQGYTLQQAGKLAEARTIYEGILAEQPEAKRSLLEAGRISLRLNELDKANAYLSKLHALAPDLPEATELLIQVNQAQKNDPGVATLIRQFDALHASGRIPAFSQSPCFVREQVRLDLGDSVIFTQYFDYTHQPFYVWRGQLVGADGTVKRQLNFYYDAKASSALAAQDPKLQNATQFILAENVLTGGKITRVDAYFQTFSLPDYLKIRNTMLAVIGGAYKPVYSQAIGTPAQ